MIDLLIPVLGRPWNAQPVVDSIVTNTASAYQIVFLCSPGDNEQLKACLDTGQTTVIVPWPAGRADYAKKINWGFELGSSEWVFQGADDIRFGKSWDSHALNLHRRGKTVIGTNDLHNPAVKRGTHSTHLLFRRDYIEERGGTFDGSGKVFSEAYDHQWIDNEFIETAKRRRVWGFSKRAIVEHFHPVWGNADWDETYRKAFRESIEDRELYVQRISQMRQVSVR